MSCPSNQSNTLAQDLVELTNKLKELVIRFDTNPSEYIKEDYGHLISILFKIRDILEKTDISKCQKLVVGATAGNISTLDSTGQVIDSGCSLNNLKTTCNNADQKATQALTKCIDFESRIAALESALTLVSLPESVQTFGGFQMIEITD